MVVPCPHCLLATAFIPSPLGVCFTLRHREYSVDSATSIEISSVQKIEILDHHAVASLKPHLKPMNLGNGLGSESQELIIQRKVQSSIVPIPERSKHLPV
jgi:hypothetical protein